MSRRPAFTLIEMMIVIGIIILLAALTLGVTVAVVSASETRQTEMTVRLLDTALKEWEAQVGRRITYGILDEPGTGARYEVNENTLDEEATAQLFALLMRSQSARDIIARIDAESIEQTEDGEFVDVNDDPLDSIRVLDAWGEPIMAVFPGRQWAEGYDALGDRDPDGTIRTATEDVCGVARNRQICFLSAGPDGEIGDLGAPAGSTERKRAEDNVYSYEPDLPGSP